MFKDNNASNKDFQKPQRRFGGDKTAGTSAASGWIGINLDKLKQSIADYWVLVVLPLPLPKKKGKPQCIVIPTGTLRERLASCASSNKQFDPYVYKDPSGEDVAFDGKGMRERIERMGEKPELIPPNVNYSEFLNDKGWKKALAGLLPK